MKRLKVFCIIAALIAVCCLAACHSESLSLRVTYDLGGATGTAPVQSDVGADRSFNITDVVPQREGYEFLGWSDGKKIYKSGDVYKADAASEIVLTAVWEYKSFTVRFYNDDYMMSEQKVPYGGGAIVPEASSDKFWLSFAGWDVSPSGITKDTDFHAQFEYESTEDSYFRFSRIKGKNEYSVSAKQGVDMPEKLALPVTYKGLPVTEIDADGFRYNQTTTQLYVPGNIKTIGAYAFSQCSVLTDVYLGEGVERLGIETFSDNRSLTKLEVPQSLTDWGICAFYGCDMLKKATVTGDNSNLVSVDGIVYSSDMDIIYLASKDIETFTVPSSVKTIWHGAFSALSYYDDLGEQHGLKEVVFEGDIKEIGIGAFMQCALLTKVTFNGEVEIIRGLDEEYIEEMNEKYGGGLEKGNCNGAFLRSALNCDIELRGIKYIGGSAFQDCFLTGITMSDTVEFIGEAAFTVGEKYTEQGYISTLEKIAFADGAIRSRNGKYRIENNCLISVGTGEKGLDTLHLYATASKADSFTTPANIGTIALTSCKYMMNVEELKISEGVVNIEENAFSNAKSLVSVELPASLERTEDELPEMFGVVYMYGEGSGPFINCKRLEKVTFALGSKLRKIAGRTFSGCALTSVTIPASVEEIGVFAFSCDTLTAINVEKDSAYYKDENGVLLSHDGKKLICYPAGKTDAKFAAPSTLEEVESTAFTGCINLEEVDFGNCANLKRLNYSAFNTCTTLGVSEDGMSYMYSGGLKKIIFPASLEFIGENAFMMCLNLEEIEFKGDAPTFDYDPDFIHNTLSYTDGGFFGNEVLFPKLKLKIPSGKENDYYVALSKYSELYTGYIDEESLTKRIYTLKDENGDLIEQVSTVILKEPEVPAKDGRCFIGWFVREGDEEKEVVFPYYNEEDVTIYAKWSDTRRADGTKDYWAIEVFDFKTVEIKTDENGVWLMFTPASDGIYNFFNVNTFTSWSSYVFDHIGVDMTDNAEVYGNLVESTADGYILEEGKTYYIFFSEMDENADSVDFMLQKVGQIEEE